MLLQSTLRLVNCISIFLQNLLSLFQGLSSVEILSQLCSALSNSAPSLPLQSQDPSPKFRLFGIHSCS